jgi:predicted esterase
MHRPLLLLLFLLPVSVAGQQIDYKGFPEWSWGKRDSSEYYLYTPRNTEDGKKYPLMLFLHGCCGSDYHATLRNAVDPPVRVWHNFGENTQTEPTYILSAKTKVGWSQHFASLKAAIDELISNGVVDHQRVYISGFSMGSEGTWKFIEAYPGYFAAAIVMGMDFKGKDPSKFKDIPIWAIRGEKDWWARHLGTQIKTIRELNMNGMDSSEWHTGVNPRLTTFEGLEHVVMWPAANELPLRDWIYSKINDGNKYPCVVIRAPAYGQTFQKGESVKIRIEAADLDGSIEKIELFANGTKINSASSSSPNLSFTAVPGDNYFQVTVIDNKGKLSTAEGKIKVNVPVSIAETKIRPAPAGKFFSHTISASGNGNLTYSVAKGSLPHGLTLNNQGTIRGIPVVEGVFYATVEVVDEDGDKEEKKISIRIRNKNSDNVILRNTKDYRGLPLPLSVVAKGISPHLRGDNEVTFSSIPEKYANLILIRTEANDTTTAHPHYLQFECDEDVTVYVAYEKLDHLFTSTIPDWLKDFKKEAGQIVTQYYYYDVYSKHFPKGLVSLLDAEEKKNGVNNNYFVMVKKSEKP